MHALCGQGIEIYSQRSRQSLAFAGAHFCNLAVIEHHAADELNVKVPHAEHAAACFAHNGKCLGQQVLQIFALGESVTKFRGFCSKLIVAELLHGGFKLIDFYTALAVLLDETVIAAAENLGKKGVKHRSFTKNAPQKTTLHFEQKESVQLERGVKIFCVRRLASAMSLAL